MAFQTLSVYIPYGQICVIGVTIPIAQNMSYMAGVVLWYVMNGAITAYSENGLYRMDTKITSLLIVLRRMKGIDQITADGLIKKSSVIISVAIDT